ncbi:hypothetical protein LUZ61_009150 [Rhynchospora tenuis]|uniref:F-box domain-containing protein n=1 Tax=Rhynchospora tenuis TaxID=198213 RepID=A0AAD6EYA3_9POAL|nr:hypothetical protein LUZ61_009150 [Rhynchospora tenuis]
MNCESRNMPGIDRISDLPRELKENILVRLPVKEAVRTCCLSSNWRLAWSSIPELVYDEHSISTPKELRYRNRDEDTMKMVKFVGKYLSFHNGSISKFVIADVKPCNKALNRWMKVLLRKGIEIIQIRSDENLYVKMWKVPPVFWNLKCLKEVVIKNCVMKLPQAFEGFKLLKSLTLMQLDISNNDLTNLIASCSLLENLVLHIAKFRRNIIIDALKLKQLDLACFRAKRVYLRAPSVVKAVLNISPVLLARGSNLTDLLNCLPKLEILELGSLSIRYLTYGCDLELSIKFHHLKSLYINMNLGCQREAAVVRQLFRCAPNLEELIVSTPYPVSYDVDNNLEKWDQSIVFEHLKFVKIRAFFNSCESDFLFFAFLLTSTPVLEKFHFYLEDENTEFLQKLVQLKRASVKAKIYNSEIIL